MNPLEQIREVLFDHNRAMRHADKAHWTGESTTGGHGEASQAEDQALARISAIVVESLGKDDKPISNIHDFSFQEAANEGRNELRAELRQQWSNQGEKYD